MDKFLSFLLIALLLAPEHSFEIHISRKSSSMAMALDGENYVERRGTTRRARPDTAQIAGSSLPDCSHACRSCSPCRLVMVSLACATLAEAETCPMAYKCTCNNKSYPVP